MSLNTFLINIHDMQAAASKICYTPMFYNMPGLFVVIIMNIGIRASMQQHCTSHLCTLSRHISQIVPWVTLSLHAIHPTIQRDLL